MSVNNNVDVINIMEIIERVENFAREYDLFKAHDKLLIACSVGQILWHLWISSKNSVLNIN